MDSIGRRGFLKALSAGAAAAGLAPMQTAWASDAVRQLLGPIPTPAPAPKFHTVVIDAGHGGVDPGCIGHTGTYEKDVVLSTAQMLARQLEVTKRFKVFMSRSDDTFVPLTERVTRARAHGADLFVSIHADALPEPSMRGASVFTLSEKASDREAAAVAERENSSDQVAGINFGTQDPEVNDILFDLARRQTNNLSIRLAQQLVTELGQRVALLRNTHRSAAFVVLKAPDVPSALVEIGCLSNHDEERALRQASYRQSVSAALYRSVTDYFDQVAAS
jgi:N-acetylmuramoyl-L-alanine amidase